MFLQIYFNTWEIIRQEISEGALYAYKYKGGCVQEIR